LSSFQGGERGDRMPVRSFIDPAIRLVSVRAAEPLRHLFDYNDAQALVLAPLLHFFTSSICSRRISRT